MKFLMRIDSVKKRLFSLLVLLFFVEVTSAALSVGKLTQTPANPVVLGDDVVYSFLVSRDALSNPEPIEISRLHESNDTFNLLIETNSGVSFIASSECIPDENSQQGRSNFICNSPPVGKNVTYEFSRKVQRQEPFPVTFELFCNDDLIKSCISGANPQQVTTIVELVPIPTPGVLEFSAATYSVKEDGGAATITVKRVGGSDGEVSVNYATSDDTATAGNDYTETSGTLIWKDGDSSNKIFTIPVMADMLKESTERVSLTLTPLGDGVVLGKRSKATLNIKNSTVLTPGVLEFSKAIYSVKEDAGAATITVKRVGGSDGEVSVNYVTSDDTATAGSDYTETSGTLIWKGGDLSSKSFTIPIVDDQLKEDIERVGLTLSSSGEGGAGRREQSKAVLTIADSTFLTPGVVQFTETLLTAAESDGEVIITVSRTGGSDGLVSVSWNSQDGSATAGDDYSASSGTLDWADGDMNDKIFGVTIHSDDIAEALESFTIDLTDAAGGVILGQTDSLTIQIESDIIKPAPLAPGTLQFSQRLSSVREEAGMAIITVQRVDGSDGVVSVQYDSRDDGAIADSDYETVSGRLIWKDGDVEDKSFTIKVRDDLTKEKTENVALSLSLPEGGAMLGQLSIAKLEIIDSRTVSKVGTLQFKNDTFWALEENGKATITVSRRGGGDGEVSVSVEIIGGTAQVEEDYQLEGNVLTWGDGDKGDKILKISLQQDENEEENESVDFRLVNATGGAKIARRSTTQLRIVDKASGFSKQPGLNDKQKELAEVIDESCVALDGGELKADSIDLKNQKKLELCVALTESTTELPDLKKALKELSPEKVVAQAKSAVEALNVQNNNISSRISALRQGAWGMSIQQFNLRVDGQQLSGALFSSLLPYGQGGGASADKFSKLGFFINGSIAFGDGEGSDREPGYDFNTKGMTFGIDYRYRSDLVVGVAMGLTDIRAEIDGDSGDMDVNANSLSLYGSYYQNSQFYLDGIVSLGWSRLDSMRKIEFSTINEAAEGKTRGNDYSLGISGGYDFFHEAFSFGPYGSLNYIAANIDGYDERSSDGSPSAVLLAIGSQKITSLSSALGAQISYAMSTQNGVFIPKLSLDWEREFKNGSRLVTARFLDDASGQIFSVRTDKPDRNYFNLDIGVSALFSHGRSGFVNYGQVIGRDKIKSYSLSGGVRFEF